MERITANSEIIHSAIKLAPMVRNLMEGLEQNIKDAPDRYSYDMQVKIAEEITDVATLNIEKLIAVLEKISQSKKV